MMKKVSVIIPVYNMEKYVETNIKYITNQTYENLEIFLINDGSSDGSLAACRRAADADERITVIDRQNGGPGAARNSGLDAASGDYAYFFDIDDEIRLNAIERLVTVMEERGVDLAACGFEISDGKKVIRTIEKTDGLYRTGGEARRDYSGQLYMYEKDGIQGALWFKLFRLDIIRAHNLRFHDFRMSEDTVFIAEYVNYIKDFLLIGDILYTYRVNRMGNFWDKYPFDIFEVSTQTTKCMLDTVYGWNRDNDLVRNKIYSDYFHKTFASLSFLFNPKLGLSVKRRYARIKEISDSFAEFVPDADMGIEHPVYRYMIKKRYLAIYVRMSLHILKHRFE